ncbi:MAG: hypothetical protein PWQ74_1360, partial [Methanobacteriaceae archaeon]|nr:hypothetical protein [Methanobacteriaceae archaeon]
KKRRKKRKRRRPPLVWAPSSAKIYHKIINNSEVIIWNIYMQQCYYTLQAKK